MNALNARGDQRSIRWGKPDRPRSHGVQFVATRPLMCHSENKTAPSSARQNTTRLERQSPSMLLSFCGRLNACLGGGLLNHELSRKMHGLVILDHERERGGGA